MSHDIPTFGEKRADLDYIDRPGAYALLMRGEKLLIVDENSGWFLPGGGLEAGESPIDALHREVLEETGFRIAAPRPLTRVLQFAVSQSDHTAYAKDCHIFTAQLAEHTARGHCELRWVAPDEAIDKLAHECFGWVVREQLIARSGA